MGEHLWRGRVIFKRDVYSGRRGADGGADDAGEGD